MSTDQVFEIANAAALVAWVLLIFIPKVKLTRIVVTSGAVSFLLAAVYSVFLFGGVNMGDFQDFSTLDGLMRMFGNKQAVLVGWLHYLAFDLFVGIWIVADSQRQNFRHLFVIPSLVFTFMMGPVGFLSYMILRQFLIKEIRPLPLHNSSTSPSQG